MREDRELSREEINAFGAELDALRERTLADLGEADARYIRRVRAVVRPSGTEPKLKCYLEVVEPVADRAGLPVAKARAVERLDKIKAELAVALGF